jgi:hypothetical protein
MLLESVAGKTAEHSVPETRAGIKQFEPKPPETLGESHHHEEPTQPDGGIALMIAAQQDECCAFERESSNFLLERDSRRALGRYEEAAYDALQAGRGRARMEQLCWTASGFSRR